MRGCMSKVMFSSFAFTAYVVRLCMADIIKRGLHERKILRKSGTYVEIPNNVLLLKALYHQVITSEDLEQFSVHSVATLLQDALWSCSERILSRKTWRLINYETCTLDYLATIIPKESHRLLTDITDFLVLVMKHKKDNLMDAYQLGDTMGKVTLGPSDCDPVLAEKAGHFLMRMIIEQSKQQKRRRHQQSLTTEAIKTEATKAKAKSYDRMLRRRQREQTWILENDEDIGLRSLLYGYPPDPPEKPYHSIFDTAFPNDPTCELSYASPVLFRILANVNQQPPSTTSDSTTKMVSTSSSSIMTEQVSYSLCHAFDDVQEWFTQYQQQHQPKRSSNEKSLFRSLSKLNQSFSPLKKTKSSQQQQRHIYTDSIDTTLNTRESGLSQDTLLTTKTGLHSIKDKRTITTSSALRESCLTTESTLTDKTNRRLSYMRKMITGHHRKLIQHRQQHHYQQQQQQQHQQQVY
ncbi:uncharacterized protein BX664DRAFT_348664 [Halteromyces radiatus]|uniref:uncharacterized protein n=1 Tax=Halteromyces radiatus TaxID=101107 RepID=UPI002220C685|nr:uncharacterized protein BX664DRAFT_348664 [Halteromyces radiatus]KAI8093442.1 hypothetical protein BX664DRAFT_348664 [Halteromyces radiatus]